MVLDRGYSHLCAGDLDVFAMFATLGKCARFQHYSYSVIIRTNGLTKFSGHFHDFGQY